MLSLEFFMCTVLLPPGVNPIAVNKHIISYTIYYNIYIISCHIYHITSYHIIYRIISYHINVSILVVFFFTYLTSKYFTRSFDFHDKYLLNKRIFICPSINTNQVLKFGPHGLLLTFWVSTRRLYPELSYQT
jgi:hypothetical protein